MATVAFEPQPETPVLITVDYRVPRSNAAAFASSMQEVGRSRRQTGALTWQLYQAGEDPERFVEIYTVASWKEHLRQHHDRLTVADRRAEEIAKSFTDENRARGAHLFPCKNGRVAQPDG
jgi:quinol monooxygenase YgiN